MPIYDYICQSCGTRTEVIHGIEAPGPRFCPACGAEGTLRKAFVAPTVHFKGSGWAKKDRSTSSRARSRSDGDGGSSDVGDRSGKGVDGGSAAKDAGASDTNKGSTSPSGSDAGSAASRPEASSASSGSASSGSASSGSASSGSETGSGKGKGKSAGSADD